MLIGFMVLFLSGDLLLVLLLQKMYRHVSLKELKRQARRGDVISKKIYSVAAFGPSLDIFLWLCAGLLSSSIFVLVAVSLPWPLAILACLVIVLVVFAWLPVSPVSRYALKIAVFCAPGVHWILERLQPVFGRAADFGQKFIRIDVHTGLYSKEDIIDLIDKQKIQHDSRVTNEELQIVKHALRFGDKTVLETMTPKRMLKIVSAEDTIGPILMGELHKSGHSRFPVENKDKALVGTLYLRDMLRAKAGGQVKAVMRPDVFYVNETRNLSHVLGAFIKTKHHMFLVVNSFEEIVGVITIEDVIEQVIGKPIMDEFDQYEDLRAVAGEHAEKDRQTRTEVIESEEAEITEKEDKK